MKRFTLSTMVLVFTISISSNAQIFPYYFSVESEVTYEPLTDSISLNNGEIWDDPDYIIPVGFEFDFYDNPIDTLYISGTTTFVLTSSNFDETQNVIIPYASDIIDIGDTSDIESVSEISYKTEGLPGEQILKIEWKNVGFFSEVAQFGTANNYLSFQAWFYEGTNDFEVRFGPNNIEDDNLVHDFGAPFLGVIENFDFVLGNFDVVWYTAGDPLAATLDTAFSITDFYTNFTGLNEDPFDGTVYRFSTSPPVATIDLLVDQMVYVYPTIANEFVNIKIEDLTLSGAEWTLIDGTGRQVMHDSFENNHKQLLVSGIPSGLYYLHVKTEKGFTTKKFFKE